MTKSRASFQCYWGGMWIETEIVTSVPTAAQLLSERKFEAIIVDCELSGAETVLKDVGSYPSNRTAVLFAVVPQMDVRDGLPGELIREYRRYFRCSLEVPMGPLWLDWQR